MKNRYEKFVLEAEKGIKFDVSDGENGELIIRALMVDKPVTSDVVKKEARILQPDNSGLNYQNPPIPDGYRYVCGEWSHGFVIERITDGSQFVWVPVGFLPANGTIDGKTFDVQFGRRNYLGDKFAEEIAGFYEPETLSLSRQIDSVKKYGGFYISRYYISKDEKTGKTQSIKDACPLTQNNYNQAFDIASSVERSISVKSHLLFGAEYDSVLEWFITSGVKTLQEIVGEAKNRDSGRLTMMEYSERENPEKYNINNIYDFGLLTVWTQEHEYVKWGSDMYVQRGKSLLNESVAKRSGRVAYNPEVDLTSYSGIGIRVALWITDCY